MVKMETNPKSITEHIGITGTMLIMTRMISFAVLMVLRRDGRSNDA